MHDEPVTVAENPAPGSPPLKSAALLIAGGLLPLLFLFDGQIGVMLFGSASMLALIAYAFWNFRRSAWMRASLLTFTAFHIAAIIAFQRISMPFLAIYIPLFLADFMVMGLVMSWVGKKIST